MSAALISLTWFALWAVFLVLIVGIWRVREVMAGNTAPNAFPSGMKHGSDAYWRANRAQANTIENLPIFASLVFVGVATNSAHGLFATLCVVVLFARIVQSLIHLLSGSNVAVNFRFMAFLVQIICFVWMGFLLISGIYGA